MNKQQLMSQLTQHVLDNNYIDIIFVDDKLDTIHCIPIKATEDMLYALNFVDFLSDGFVVLRLEDVKEIIHNDTCEYFGDIVKKEGALELIHDAPTISLNDWRTVFTSLKDDRLICIVDIGKENCVNVGKIIDTLEQCVVMRCFSPVGIWDDEEWEEPYNNITSVRFLSHYAQIYFRYLEDNN